MNEKKVDEFIEEMLNRPEGYIPDDGFTARVIETLPGSALNERVRFLIITVSALAACAVGCFIVPGGRIIVDAVTVSCARLMALQVPPVSALVVLGLLAWGVFAVIGKEAGDRI